MQINKNQAGTIAAGIVVASAIIGTFKVATTSVSAWWTARKIKKALKEENNE